MSRYKWEPGTNERVGRYRDTATGRFVSQAVVREELDRTLDRASSEIAGALAEALRNRQISVADWEVRMMQHIKDVHLNAIALERGGWANMTAQDYGRAGGVIARQYKYLHNFAGEIVSGKQKLDGSLVVRAKMYTQAGRTTYHRSRQASVADTEITHVRSTLNPADHCDECVELDGRWFRIGDPRYKLPGQRICRTNCHCDEELGRDIGGEIVVA